VRIPDVEDVTVTFGSMFAAILRVEGDTVLGAVMKAEGPAKQGLGFAEQARGRVWHDLRTRFPDAVLWVAPLKAVEAPSVSFSLLLETGGFQELSIKPVVLREPPVVTTVSAESFRPGSGASNDVTVRILGPDGTPFPAADLLSFEYRFPGTEKDPQFGSGISGLRIHHGARTRLPVGHYRVWSINSLIADHLRTSDFDVRSGAPQVVDILVDGTWRQCRVRVIDESGAAIHQCTVVVRLGEKQQFVSIDDNSRIVWLPIGKGTARLQDQKYSAGESDLEVATSGPTEIQDITLRAERR
jgi:hypothetical protein